MNRREWGQSLAPCEETFGHWFTGFLDGEGCFSISRSGSGYRCDLIIKLRADDVGVLHTIRDILDMGVISMGQHAGNGNPWARWAVTKKSDLIRLTEILDAFQLRTKKFRDYIIWRDAAIYWATSDTPVDWEPMAKAFEDLRKIREYVDPDAKPHGNRVGIHREGGRHG